MDCLFLVRCLVDLIVVCVCLLIALYYFGVMIGGSIVRFLLVAYYFGFDCL